MFSVQMREAPAFPRWLWLLLLLSLAGNVLAWLSLGLLPDEAYYWVWSQRLDLSYFDHPPLVAWLMRPFTELFGSSTAAIRLPAVLSWLVGAVVGYDFARRLYGQRRAGGLAVLIWATLPIVQVGFHIVTPDTPLIIFTWLTFYFAYLAVAGQRPWLWLVTGLCMGLALLAKYPAVLVLAALFLALLFSRDGRRALTGPGPWLGAVVALAVFAPVVVWNAQHQWISFAFQLGHGVQQSVAPDPGKMFLLFLGGQLAVAMPWTFFAMAWASVSPAGWHRRAGGFPVWLLGLGFWLPLLVFGAAGLTADSGPNWPETAYVPGTVLLAGALHSWLYPPARPRGTARPLLLVTVFVLALMPVLLIDLMRFPDWLAYLGYDGLTQKRTQLSQAYGWDQVGAEMRRLLPAQEAHNPAGAQCKVATGYHASAGMLAWLLQAPERVVTTPGSRISQYQLWEREAPTAPAQLCLFVDKYDSEAMREEQVPTEVDLGNWGRWRRVSLLAVHNPDLSLRWYGFFVPEQDGAPAAP